MAQDRMLALLFSEAARLKTFEGWPNETTGSCTPAKLAEVGFFFLPCEESPDNVCCIFCQKELDGWEPDDDPFEEHKKHSKECPSLKTPQPFSMMSLTIKQIYEFLKNISLHQATRQMEKNIKGYIEEAERVEKELKDILH